MKRLIIATLLLTWVWSAAAGRNFGPWSADPRHPTMQSSGSNRAPENKIASSSPFSLAFAFWSRLLTRVDGPRCAHQPTCSAYAHQAMARHGLPLGAWLALNRLMRGAHSSVLRRLPTIRNAHGIFYLDPL